jgi:hypothetical protein
MKGNPIVEQKRAGFAKAQSDNERVAKRSDSRSGEISGAGSSFIADLATLAST